MAKKIRHIQNEGSQQLMDLACSQRYVGCDDPWTTCCVITFPDNQSALTDADRNALMQIVPHLMRNPLPQAAVDGFRDPNNQDLSDQRSRAVHAALVNAGVMPDRICVGAYGDPQFGSIGRVEVLSRYNFKPQRKDKSFP